MNARRDRHLKCDTFFRSIRPLVLLSVFLFLGTVSAETCAPVTTIPAAGVTQMKTGSLTSDLYGSFVAYAAADKLHVVKVGRDPLSEEQPVVINERFVVDLLPGSRVSVAFTSQRIVVAQNIPTTSTPAGFISPDALTSIRAYSLETGEEEAILSHPFTSSTYEVSSWPYYGLNYTFEDWRKEACHASQPAIAGRLVATAGDDMPIVTVNGAEYTDSLCSPPKLTYDAATQTFSPGPQDRTWDAMSPGVMAFNFDGVEYTSEGMNILTLADYGESGMFTDFAEVAVRSPSAFVGDPDSQSLLMGFENANGNSGIVIFFDVDGKMTRYFLPVILGGHAGADGTIAPIGKNAQAVANFAVGAPHPATISPELAEALKFQGITIRPEAGTVFILTPDGDMADLVSGTNSGDYFGASVAPMGDVVSNDGVPEVLVAAPGGRYVSMISYSENATGIVYSMNDQSADGFGSAVASVNTTGGNTADAFLVATRSDIKVYDTQRCLQGASDSAGAELRAATRKALGLTRYLYSVGAGLPDLADDIVAEFPELEDILDDIAGAKAIDVSFKNLDETMTVLLGLLRATPPAFSDASATADTLSKAFEELRAIVKQWYEKEAQYTALKKEVRALQRKLKATKNRRQRAQISSQISAKTSQMQTLRNELDGYWTTKRRLFRKVRTWHPGIKEAVTPKIAAVETILRDLFGRIP